MSQFVVDASIAVKWFVPEVYSEHAERLLDDRHELFVPDLLYPEFGNILWKKVRKGEISKKEGVDILTGLAAVPLRIHASAPLTESAYEIALTTSRTVYDSLYLALAILKGCQMVTADEKFRNALQNTVFAKSLLWVEDVPPLGP